MEPYCFQITADNEPRPKYQRSSCATSKKHGSTWKPWNCFKEQLHGFLLTFEWCHGSQMMLISLNRNTAPVHSRVVQCKVCSCPCFLTKEPILGLSGPHVCNLRDGCDDATWSPPHVVPAFSSSFRPITCFFSDSDPSTNISARSIMRLLVAAKIIW